MDRRGRLREVSLWLGGGPTKGPPSSCRPMAPAREEAGRLAAGTRSRCIACLSAEDLAVGCGIGEAQRAAAGQP